VPIINRDLLQNEAESRRVEEMREKCRRVAANIKAAKKKLFQSRFKKGIMRFSEVMLTDNDALTETSEMYNKRRQYMPAELTYGRTHGIRVKKGEVVVKATNHYGKTEIAEPEGKLHHFRDDTKENENVNMVTLEDEKLDKTLGMVKNEKFKLTDLIAVDKRLAVT